MVEARAAEMTIEEAEGAIAEEAASTNSGDEIVVPVGVVEVAISAGPDGEFGTDDDEVEVRARGSSDDASTEEAPEAEAEPEAEEAPAEETATWTTARTPGTERDHANGLLAEGSSAMVVTPIVSGCIVLLISAFVDPLFGLGPPSVCCSCAPHLGCCCVSATPTEDSPRRRPPGGAHRRAHRSPPTRTGHAPPPGFSHRER